MPPTATAAFRSWLKANTGMTLTYDLSVTRILYEGITTYDSLLDFDTNSIQSLPAMCKGAIPAIEADDDACIAAEAAVPGANISTISTRHLIIAVNVVKYYTSIGRAITPANMHYANVLSDFKIEWEDYESLKKQDDPDVPSISDKDNDRKIIKWVPIFIHYTSHTYGSRGPLSCVLCDSAEVSTELNDPLEHQAYYGAS